MTTIVAVKKNDEVSISTDSLVLYGRCKESDSYVENSCKIIKIHNWFIGMSGHSSIPLILEEFAAKKRCKSESLYEFLSFLYQEMKDHFYLTDKENNPCPFNATPLELIAINESQIYEIDYSRGVRELTKIAAVGTGEDYALGAMEANYEMDLSAKELAEIGIRTASHFDLLSELPLYSCVAKEGLIRKSF